MIRHNAGTHLKQRSLYHLPHATGDLTAGIIVTFLLIPQSMAYASLAGVPLTMGLYAGTFPLLIYAVFGSSKYLSVGPVSVVSLLTFTGLSNLMGVNDHSYIELVIILSLMVGIVQLLMGFFRLGFLLRHIASSVISGFISALALIIIANQLPSLIGITRPAYSNLFTYALELFGDLPSVHWITASIGLTSLLLILIINKTLSASPAPLVVILASIIVVNFFHLDKAGVEIVGPIPIDLLNLSLIIPTWEMFSSLLPLAVIISFVSFLESFSVAKSLADKDNEYVNVNQELTGIGLANLTSSFTGSMPVSGALSRSAVNYDSGAKTKLSLVITALLMLLAILYMTPLFYYLPKAALAAIIVFAVIKLVNIHQLIFYLKNEPAQALIFLATFFVTLMIGIVQGLISGMMLSLIYRGLREIVRK